LIWKEYNFLTGGNFFAAVKLLFYGMICLVVVAMELNSNNSAWGISAGIAMLVIAGFEASSYASRVLSEEIKTQTLSTLILLPLSSARIVYTKILGCAIALFPALFWAALLLLLQPYESVKIVGHGIFWFVLFIVALLLSLTMYLSLYLKWGSLPAAFGIIWVLFQCCPIGMLFMLVVGQMDRTEFAIPIILIAGGVVIAPLHVLIIKSLKKIATR